MPVRLHHIVVDAHDLPCLARFWTQALGWKVLSERENEIVIGTDENAPVGMCSTRQWAKVVRMTSSSMSFTDSGSAQRRAEQQLAAGPGHTVQLRRITGSWG